jgi:hypothetical protein
LAIDLPSTSFIDSAFTAGGQPVLALPNYAAGSMDPGIAILARDISDFAPGTATIQIGLLDGGSNDIPRSIAIHVLIVEDVEAPTGIASNIVWSGNGNGGASLDVTTPTDGISIGAFAQRGTDPGLVGVTSGVTFFGNGNSSASPLGYNDHSFVAGYFVNDGPATTKTWDFSSTQSAEYYGAAINLNKRT